MPLADRDDARPKRRGRQKAEATDAAGAEDLDDEIRDFMNRNQRGLSEEDDLSDFLGQGIDPNID